MLYFPKIFDYLTTVTPNYLPGNKLRVVKCVVRHPPLIGLTTDYHYRFDKVMCVRCRLTGRRCILAKPLPHNKLKVLYNMARV